MLINMRQAMPAKYTRFTIGNEKKPLIVCVVGDKLAYEHNFILV